MDSSLIGSMLSTRLVKAHWAWSELTSPRFAREYQRLGEDAVRLQDVAKRGAAFSSLTHADVDLLVSLIEQRQSQLLANIRDVSNFRCVGWSKDELLGSLTIQTLGPDKRSMIDYSRFLSNPPFFVDGKPEWSDPRVSADSWADGKLFSQQEPAIGIWYQGRRVLLDGYGRSVIFARHGGDAGQFLVWMPEDGRYARGK